MSPVSPALAGRFFTTKLPGKPSDDDKVIHKVYKLPLLFIELIPRGSDSQRNVERSYCLKTSEMQGILLPCLGAPHSCDSEGVMVHMGSVVCKEHILRQT